MFDFCINGGGMIGSALALGLTQQGYQVALIEPDMPQPYQSDQPPDLRVSAVGITSVDLLRALGAWEHVAKTRLREYSSLSVWERPSARLDFDASMAGVETLGYFVENRLLQLGCHDALASVTGLTWYKNKQVEKLHITGGSHATITLDDDTTIKARWLIGADGAKSAVRKAAAIGSSGWQYDQQALGVVVQLAEPVANNTWQQFTPTGPRAFLPMYGNYASLIWYDSAAKVKQLQPLSDEALKEQIKTAFPDELVDFTIVGKAAFPLTRAHASDYVRPNVLLIGDAAHTINPLAGQGVNLGFRDISSLLEITANHRCDNYEHFYTVVKQQYEGKRRRDNLAMMTAMDGFYLLFSNDNPALSLLRNGMLKLSQQLYPAKQQVLRYALGLNQWKF